MEKITEEESKDKKELKNYVESQEALADQLKKQLQEHKQQITSKENILAEMKTLHAKALEKRNTELEQLILEKTTYITGMEKLLEEESEHKNALNNFIKDQEAVVGDLEKQINEYKDKVTEKEEQLNEKEEECAKKEETQQSINEGHIKQLNDNKATIAQQENHLIEINAQHQQALEKLQHDLEQIALENTACITDLDKTLEEETEKKNVLTNVVESQKAVIGDLEGHMNDYKQNVTEREEQLNEMKEEYTKELKTQKEVNDEYLKQLDEHKARIGQQDCHLIEVNAQHVLALEKLQCDLEQVALEKTSYINDMEKTLEERTDQKDVLTNFVQNQEASIGDLQRQINEYKFKVTEKEEELNEKKDEYAKKLETQEAINEEHVKQLNEKKAVIAQQENHLVEINAQHQQALENLQCDLEQIVLKKMACISDMEKSLEEETEKKDALTNVVNCQEGVIGELEKQINENKDKVARTEEQLNETKEQYTKEVETQETLNEEHLKQLNKQKATIVQQEKDLIEIDAQHTQELEKLQSNLEQIVVEKAEYITDMEKSFDEETEKRDVLTNFVQNQEAVIRDLKRQIDEYKDKVAEKEEQLNETKEEHAKKVETLEAVKEEQLKQLNENNTTMAQQEINLIEMDVQHQKALEKLQCDLEQVALEKTAYITDMEKSLEEETEQKNVLTNFTKSQEDIIGNLEKQINEYKVKVREKEEQLNETKEEYAKEVKRQEAVNEEHLKKLNEHKASMFQQENHLIEINALHQQALKKLQCEVQKLENEKHILIDTVKKLEETLLNLEYEMKKKREEVRELQKSQHEMQLDHVNEIRNLNNEHRKQLGSLIDIPEKDRNIKSLLLELQKEADEVLDLMINVPQLNENTSVAKESTFTEMSSISNANMSTEGMEDFLHDQIGEMSIASMESDIQAVICDENYGQPGINGLEDQLDTATDSILGHGNAFLHDNHVVSQFDKLLKDESNKVEVLTMKLEEEGRRRESIQMSHEVELRKIVERELNLKEKYLKVAELLQKEKNAKTRLMGMLSDAQIVNEIQSRNLEEVQNDKNSLLESYAMVSELENLLTEEKQRRDLANAKLEKEKYDKLSMQASLADEKAELKATKDREIYLKENCRELKKLLENETEERKNIADTLDYEKKMIILEKKNLEQKQFALNQKLAGLGNDTLVEKIKSLKAWEGELKKREKSISGKEGKVKNLIAHIEQGYDILPQKQAKDGVGENNGEEGTSRPEEAEWLKQIQSDQLLDTKHLPLVADLNQKIKNLQKEKGKLADNLNELKEEIIEYKKQLKDYKNNAENKELKLSDSSNGLQSAGSTQDNISADGQKLLNAGWTIAKVQRLYLKYFRAESFRKALVYQKRYLTLMLKEKESQPGSVYSWLNGSKRKYNFKVVVLAVIAIRRMKYLVQKYHRNLYKSSPDYPYKDKIRINSKKTSVENDSDDEQHSLSYSERRNIASKPLPSANTPSKGNSPKQLPTNASSKGYPWQPPAKYIIPSTRLPVSEPAIIRRDLNDRSLEPGNDWLSRSDISNNRLRVNEGNGTHFNGSYVNNMDHVTNVSASSANRGNGGVPRSYPRSSGILRDESPSKLSRTNGDSTPSNSRLDKSPYTSRPFVSPTSPLLSSTSRDIQESKDKGNESLSSYIESLETLHNRLKTVGYNDAGRSSLL